MFLHPAINFVEMQQCGEKQNGVLMQQCVIKQQCF
jgi:hypothetical protein